MHFWVIFQPFLHKKNSIFRFSMYYNKVYSIHTQKKHAKPFFDTTISGKTLTTATTQRILDVESNP